MLGRRRPALEGRRTRCTASRCLLPASVAELGRFLADTPRPPAIWTGRENRQQTTFRHLENKLCSTYHVNNCFINVLSGILVSELYLHLITCGSTWANCAVRGALPGRCRYKGVRRRLASTEIGQCCNIMSTSLQRR